MTQSIGTPVLWIGFTLFVIVMLAIDLGVFNRKAHEVHHREALIWTAVWVSLAVAFNVWVFLNHGKELGLEFLTGYVIEYSLSIDNLFVFLLVFRYFAVPKASQHRTLFWGILGALVMRAIFIFLGAVLLESFNWIIYVFGGFLVFTGIKMLNGANVEIHPERNPVVRLFQRLMPVTRQYYGARFLVREGGRKTGRWVATPLLLVLVVVEATDVVFAVDSIPAIFAITRDPFIVFTSNIFAILGLRSLYFLLAAAMTHFHHLKLGLGAVLAFVGAKMMVSEFYEIPIVISLIVVGVLLGGSVVASMVWPLSPAMLIPNTPADPLHVQEHPRSEYFMTIDPVCKMDVDEAKAAATSSYQGKTYYFCAVGCKKTFEQNPEKYLAAAK